MKQNYGKWKALAVRVSTQAPDEALMVHRSEADLLKAQDGIRRACRELGFQVITRRTTQNLVIWRSA